jgi:hypothetical protein
MFDNVSKLIQQDKTILDECVIKIHETKKSMKWKGKVDEFI